MLVGGAIAGLMVGAGSGAKRHCEVAFGLPLVMAFGAMALFSSDYERNGNLGTLLVGVVPYAATFFIGIKIRSRRKG